MAITVQSITWDQIRPIWENDLWPNRTTWQIRTHSTILGSDALTVDLDIFNDYTANYYGVFDTDGTTIIGVNSGHQVDDTTWRTRGLWVDPNHRRQGIATALLNKTISDAQAVSGINMIFGFPRTDSLDFYQSVGFTKIGDDFRFSDSDKGSTGYNYPANDVKNCYAEKSI